LGNRDEGGYVLVMLTAGLFTMIVAASFAVDIGGWYSRQSEIQRGADAAALSGVVWMPDFPTAQTAALAAAARNGFVPGGAISIVVAPVAGSSRQLTVTITDADAPRYFSGSVVAHDQSLTRAATAEYVLPVPLGSPKNTFGTGDLLAGANRENFWAAVNGYCAGHESGDVKLARYESYTTATGASLQCSPAASPQTADYDPTGYLYAIEMPQSALALHLEVYDGGYNTSLSTPDIALATDAQAVTTTYQVFGSDNTPLDTSDNPLLSTTTIATNNLVYKNLWVPLQTWVNPVAGTYYLRVKTSAAQTTESRASNGFALRAYTGALFVTCTSIVGATGYSASCPQIHGVGDMSIYANLSGVTATFYLAQVAALHAGKTMQLTLFDSGEGATKIEVLDPNGNPATFSWRTPCNPPTSPTGGCSASNVTSLNVSGTGTQPYTGLQSTSKYNDRRMILDVKLPANYTTVYGTKVWWQIRYTVGTSASDRTTWSVNIIGDPVHLVGG
jgi:hypothetical protein